MFDPTITCPLPSAHIHEVTNSIIEQTGFAFFISPAVSVMDEIPVSVDDVPASKRWPLSAARSQLNVIPWVAFASHPPVQTVADLGV